MPFHDWPNVDCSSLHFFDPYLFNMIRPHCKTVKRFKMRGGFFGTNLAYPLTLMTTITHFTNLHVLVLKRNRYLLKLDILPKLNVLTLDANYQILSQEFAKHLPGLKCLTDLSLARNPQIDTEHLLQAIVSLSALLHLNIHGIAITNLSKFLIFAQILLNSSTLEVIWSEKQRSGKEFCQKGFPTSLSMRSTNMHCNNLQIITNLVL